jgi:hypothetical protein
MSPISILALVLVLWLLALTVGVLGLVSLLPERPRRQIQRVARWVAAAMLGALLLGASVTVPNMVRSDAVDRLPTEDRAAVRVALRLARECPRPTRVTEIKSSPERPARYGFQYRCEWTVLGWPTTTGKADCMDGGWVVPGFFETSITGVPCGDAIGN